MTDELDVVYFPETGIRLPHYRFQGAQIADLRVLPQQSEPTSVTPSGILAHGSTSAPGLNGHQANGALNGGIPPRPAGSTGEQVPAESAKPLSIPSRSTFLADPAIVSMSRQFSKSTISSNSLQHLKQDDPQRLPEPPKGASFPISIGIGSANGPVPEQSSRAESGMNKGRAETRDLIVTKAAVEQRHEERISGGGAKENVPPSQGTDERAYGGWPLDPESDAKKRKRVTSGGLMNHPGSSVETAPVNGLGSSPLDADKEDEGTLRRARDRRAEGRRGKRQGLGSTAHLGVQSSAQLVSRSKFTARRPQARAPNYTDGWATEDATDIQGMGEFDFAGNLSKFDKRSIFDQMRAEDMTADESCLVTLNRRPARLGIGGGKNLHHTESVLDVPNDMGTWNSEAGETEAELSETEQVSGNSSRRATSRQPVKQHSFPTESAAPGLASRKMSSSTQIFNPMTRGPSFATQSSLKTRDSRPSVGPSVFGNNASAKPSLRMALSGRPCPVVGPVQMLDVERLAEAELGLTEDMTTENAARGIAEVAFAALDAGDRRWPARKRTRMPVMVVLAGNNQTGVRAVAGARHLCNHGVRVILCILGLVESEVLLPDNMRRHLAIFRSSGGRLVRSDDFSTNQNVMRLAPEVIVDALFGIHLSFGDLSRQDQTSAYGLIKWANRSKADILAVDMPTGIDASTGK